MVVRYRVDPAHSRFTVQAFVAGVLAAFGHNPIFVIRNFQGELLADPQTMQNASFSLAVQADSLELTDSVPPNHRDEIQRLMRHQALEVDRFPQIEFHGDQIVPSRIADNWFRTIIRGKMFLHGVANPMEIDAQARVQDSLVRLNGKFSLSQAAYGITQISSMGGMIRVKDELQFAFDLVAKRAETTDNPLPGDSKHD